LNRTLNRYDKMLGSLTQISIPLGDITAVATAFMTDYGIASYDAAHAASAIAAGAEAIVTVDTAFALLPSSLLMVYTDRSRLVSCRRKRPR
jgi:predicted nucleic acid-binding protein